MAYTKRTLRRLPPNTRKVAVRLNEIETALRALKRTLPRLAEHEQLARALDREERRKYEARLTPGGDLFDPDTEAAAKALRGEL
jgi:ribosomal protein S21